MLIIVASTSPIKLGSVREVVRANGLQASIIGVPVASGVNEQPVDEETLRGARNRAHHARELRPDADFYISIENGIFRESETYYDKAVILIVTKDGTEHVRYSESVEFPAGMVELARIKDFEKTTVGEVMQKAGLIKNRADPHLDLIGKSRAAILTETISSIFQSMGLEKQPELSLRSAGQKYSPKPTF